MSGNFNIQLSNDFPQAEKGMANFELGLFNTVMKGEMNLFKQAWAGWPADDTAPQANRSEQTSQNMIDAGLQMAFGDLWKK
jgi:hypothetical protein